MICNRLHRKWKCSPHHALFCDKNIYNQDNTVYIMLYDMLFLVDYSSTYIHLIFKHWVIFYSFDIIIWVRILLMAKYTRYDRHDITEILLKVELNTINQAKLDIIIFHYLCPQKRFFRALFSLKIGTNYSFRVFFSSFFPCVII